MEKLDQIEMAAKDLIGYYCPDYTFVWDSTKVRKGECRYGPKQIGLSRPIAELNTFECMLLTIIHEIAHALTRSGHDRNWKRLCLELGGDGQRAYSASETITPKRYGFLGVCPSCYRTIRRLRRTRIACKRCCNGIFNEEFLFVWSRP